MPGETRRAVFAQPEWLRSVPTDRRLPADARVVFTGCGTSFHAAQTGGRALEALEVTLDPPRDADLLVCISHEGGTKATNEAARAFPAEVWAVTGAADSRLADIADEVVVCTPELERSMCHTASYTCAVAAIAAMSGEDVSWLKDAVEEVLSDIQVAIDHQRVVVAGGGRDWPTAQEAALKLREGAYLDAHAFHLEELLHGHLAAIDETFRAFVLSGPAPERAQGAAAALETLGCETTVIDTRHPVVDIVPFQLLTLATADARGIDPDQIRRDDPRWARARAAYP